MNDYPPKDSKEWADLMDLMTNKLPEAHRKELSTHLGFGGVTIRKKKGRSSRIPVTIEEVPDEENERTYSDPKN